MHLIIKESQVRNDAISISVESFWPKYSFITLIITYLFSSLVPITNLISNSILSIDKNPTVIPLIIPAKQVRTIYLNS